MPQITTSLLTARELIDSGTAIGFNKGSTYSVSVYTKVLIQTLQGNAVGKTIRTLP